MKHETEDLRGAHYIDSRDVIARIDYLEFELSERKEQIKELKAAEQELPDDDADDLQEELAALKALEDEASSCGDWHCGETLIRDDCFTEYAQELAEDISAISSDAKWPNNHIDWDAAAEELKTDYTDVRFNGRVYWIRS